MGSHPCYVHSLDVLERGMSPRLWIEFCKRLRLFVLPWKGKMREEEGPICIGAKVCPEDEGAKE